MHNSKLKQITVALCMALVPVSVFAAGLGKLNVMSGLGEPLKADIELIAVTPEELNSLTASIASEEAYSTQGIEKPASHNTIKVGIAKNAAGAPILKLNSAQPISEPFLDMLIQVDWASGRLLREYTVLLDPPGYTGEADPSAQTAQAPMVKSFSKNKKSDTKVMPDDNVPADAMPANDSAKPNKRSKKASPATETDVAEASGDDYKTKRGDTLAKIASEMKPEGVSLEQMLVGLYQANPNAFQGNMNRLKVGQILRQPTQDELNAVSKKQAASEIKVQAANWNAYRNKLGAIVAEAPSADAESSSQSATGKIKSAEDKSEPATTGPKDVVKLSAGDAALAKAATDDIKTLQAKVNALQEEAIAREKSVKEAQDRTADLEKQIADMQKLLALKNGAMADVQKQAEAEANKPEAAAEPAKPVAEAKPAETTNPADKPAEAAKPAAPANVEAKPKPAATPEAAPAEEPSFIGGLMDNLDMGLLAPAGGLLAALGGGWLYLRKKREKNLADFEQGIMTSGGLKANTVFGNTASASVDTGDTSFLTDFSQSANGGMIDTNDVDPIAEAEVYMAYGRDAQAEEILKDAISKEPKRYELHLKLLEMYAASKNMSAFETISGELYTTLGAEDPVWAKVSEIGIKLEPNNPLYQANSSPTGATGGLDSSDFANTPLAAEKDLDFSFDNDALVQDFAEDTPAKIDTAAVDFDDTPSNAEQAPTVALDEAIAAPASNNDALEFDMGDFAKTDKEAAGFENTGMAASVESTDAKFGNTMPALDMPTFDAPEFMPKLMTEMADAGSDAIESFGLTDAATDNAQMVAEKTDNLDAFGDLNADAFDFLNDETPAAAQPEIALDLSGGDAELATDFNFDELSNGAAEPAAESEFSFDINTISPEANQLADASDVELNPIDLNGISLDLNESTSTAETNALLGGDEPIEVETKLELVTAYIDMDDKEGALELLQEVMKEGGANQRKRAEEIMAKLA